MQIKDTRVFKDRDAVVCVRMGEHEAARRSSLRQRHH